MNLPIPTKLEGWSVAILVLILLFAAYYGCFFTDLQSFYAQKQFSAGLGGQKPLSVNIDVPRYVAPFGQGWVYVKICNQYSFPLRNVLVWLDVRSSDGKEEVDRQNLPFLFGTSVTRPEILTFEQIPSGGTAHGRLPLFIANPDPVIPRVISPTVTVWVSSTMGITTPISITVSGEVKVNAWRYLAHSYVEQILLPPWSNGLLVLLVFVVCTLVEKKFSGTEGGESREWWREWWKVFYHSFMLVSFLTGVAFILPCLPWLLAWGEWKGFKQPEIAILAFLWAWMSIFVFLISLAWWILESRNLTSGTPFERWFEKWRSWMANLPLVNRRKRLQCSMPFVSIVFFLVVVLIVIEVLRQSRVTFMWIYFVKAVVLAFCYFLLMVWLPKRIHPLSTKKSHPLVGKFLIPVIRASVSVGAPLILGIVLLVLEESGRRNLSSSLFPHIAFLSPLRSLLPILFGAIIVEFLATMIKGAQTLFIPKPSGGRIWKRTGGSRQPREYFRRSGPPRRKSG